jgi:hypothetical protein
MQRAMQGKAMTIMVPAERDLTAAAAPAIVFEAIVKQLCLAATYNRGEVVIAPHVVFMRHDELYVDAVTLERDGKPPREEKLGTFKLAGLVGPRVTPRRFTLSTLFQPGDPKYEAALVKVEG